jgi:hypothetical protein
VSPPVGPTGLRYCSGDDAELDWHVGVSGAWSGTHLELSTGGQTFDTYFGKYVVTASLERRLGDRWTLGGALGSTVTGALDLDGVTTTVSPGPLAAITASFRPLDEGDLAPFVLLTGSAAASVAWTAAPAAGSSSTLSAFDLRLGVVAGKTFAHVVTPYLLARAFGGPVFWSGGGRSLTGTDANHYQLGAGVSVRLGRFDLVLEGVPLGELALVAGAGFAF